MNLRYGGCLVAIVLLVYIIIFWLDEAHEHNHSFVNDVEVERVYRINNVPFVYLC